MNIENTPTKSPPQTGFTIIELMIATIVFSVVMVVIITSFLQIGRLYYKGVSLTSTSEDTRTLLEDITNDVRTAQTAPMVIRLYNGNTASYFCIASHRYAFKLGQKVTGNDVEHPNASNPVGVIENDMKDKSCPVPDSSNSNGARQLLGANMQLNLLQFDGSDHCTPGVCNLAVYVVYYGADNSVFYSPSSQPGPPFQAKDATCTGNLLSTQFCAAMGFNTNILIGGI